MKTIASLFLMMGTLTGCQSFWAPNPEPSLSPEGFMTKYDVNRDGRISTDEFDGRLNVFVALDTNNDSYITASEAPENLPPIRNR